MAIENKNKTCSLCGKVFKTASTYRTHKSLKTCQKVKQNPCECRRCLKIFKSPESRRGHMARNICEVVVATPIENEGMPISNISNSNSFNTTNNTTNNNNNINVNITNNYGNENLDYIRADTEALTKAVIAGQAGLQDIIKKLYFNPEHPENSTVQLTNSSKNDCKVYNAETETWDYKPIRNVLFDLSFQSTTPMNEHYIKNMKYITGPQKEFERLKMSILTSDLRTSDKLRAGTAEDRKLMRKIEQDTRCTMLNNRHLFKK